MAFLDIVDTVLNPVFGWMFDLHPLVAILILSVALGLLNTLLQKYMTDQAKMKRLKDDTKKLQKKMKEHQKAGEQDKMMKTQQKLMPIQMQLMKQSFRPLIVTMVPFLLIFFWLANHFAFLPIMPGEPFTVTAVFADGAGGNATLVVPESLSVDSPTKQVDGGRVVWELSGPKGRYDLTLQYAGGEFDREVLITEDREYAQPKVQLKGTVEELNVDNEKLTPGGEGFNLFGWFPGWIFYYIIFSIPVSLGLKKVLKVV